MAAAMIPAMMNLLFMLVSLIQRPASCQRPDGVKAT
jgi:hypothetical protein